MSENSPEYIRTYEKEIELFINFINFYRIIAGLVFSKDYICARANLFNELVDNLRKSRYYDEMQTFFNNHIYKFTFNKVQLRTRFKHCNK